MTYQFLLQGFITFQIIYTFEHLNFKGNIKTMGKGDHTTRRGKLFRGTYGKLRRKKKNKKLAIAEKAEELVINTTARKAVKAEPVPEQPVIKEEPVAEEVKKTVKKHEPEVTKVPEPVQAVVTSEVKEKVAEKKESKPEAKKHAPAPEAKKVKKGTGEKAAKAKEVKAEKKETAPKAETKKVTGKKKPEAKAKKPNTPKAGK